MHGREDGGAVARELVGDTGSLVSNAGGLEVFQFGTRMVGGTGSASKSNAMGRSGWSGVEYVPVVGVVYLVT
jgi:hypothetical protein